MTEDDRNRTFLVEVSTRQREHFGRQCHIDVGIALSASERDRLVALAQRGAAEAPFTEGDEEALTDAVGLVASERNKWEGHDQRTYEHWAKVYTLLASLSLRLGYVRERGAAEAGTCATCQWAKPSSTPFSVLPLVCLNETDLGGGLLMPVFDRKVWPSFGCTLYKPAAPASSEEPL